jgi:hypothetical protein
MKRQGLAEAALMAEGNTAVAHMESHAVTGSVGAPHQNRPSRSNRGLLRGPLRFSDDAGRQDWAGQLPSPVVSGDCWITRVFAAKASDSVDYDKCNIAPAASA